MRVFITGGAGFIGLHLARGLVSGGHHATIYDDLSNSSRDRIPRMDGIRFIEGDIMDGTGLEQASADHDIIVHLAARISVQESVRDPAGTHRINVDGTRNVIDACAIHNMGVVAASSAAIFGDSGDILYEDSACEPLSPYGQSKLEMEKVLRGSGVDHVILRFFNIYGPGQSPEYSGVISKFAGFIRDKSDIIIYGDGEQTRDFVAIDDAVGAIVCAIGMESRDTYNIGTGIATSINHLAVMMQDVSGSRCNVVHADERPGEIRFATADSTKAREQMGFECSMKLEDGVRKYWDEF